MYPKIVLVEFWDCGKGHRHRSEEIALKCIEGKPLIVVEDTKYRLARQEVVRNILKGDTFKEAAQKSNVSDSYARAIFWKQIRLVKNFANRKLKIFFGPIYRRQDVKSNSTILLECFERMWEDA